MERKDFIRLGSLGALGICFANPASATFNQLEKRFENKVVIVTGGSSGIGKEAVRKFAHQGAKVAFCARGEDRGRAVEQELRNAGVEVMYINADVRDEQQIKSFTERVLEKWGKLDVAFNNAGAIASYPLHETPVEVWDDIHNTNIRGVFLCMKYQIPYMMKNGGGNIVITSSAHQQGTRPGGAAYSASKHAINGIVKAAAMDYGTHNIRVNSIAPGAIDTPLFRSLSDTVEKVSYTIDKIDALKRLGTAEEIAALAVWLASDECKYITGTSILVDGGMLSGL